jgi:ribosomal protein S12 methylthiotransferase
MASSQPRHRVFLRTLGCPKNEVDGNVLRRNLEMAGCEIVDDPDDADVEIVNTCGFIEATKVESLDAIWEAVDRKALSNSQDRRLIVTGCLAQRYGKELSQQIDQIDAVVGFDRPDLVLKTLDATNRGAGACWVEKPGRLYREDALAVGWPEGTQAPLSAYIKIADGCDNACRFCAIPQIRGRMRSRAQDAIVAEIRNLVHSGTREVILVAQDTTSWGIDIPEKPDLADLLQAIDEVDGSFWIRLMYAHPAFLTDRQIETIAHCGKLIPYIDMPLQHTSDRMLDIMNRHITAAQTQDRIDRLRAARTDMAIRTTFILGHPGETDADFEHLLEFASENAFERMGVFPYSAEEGTPSAQMDEVVPELVTRERIERLTEAFDRWSAEFSIDLLGRTVPCLLERQDGNEWEGRTAYDAPEIDGRVMASGAITGPGLYNVRLTDALGIDVRGAVIAADDVTAKFDVVTLPEERE